MHGREVEEKRKRRWHMWRVPVFGKTVAAVDSTTTNFFYKDGRKISVGDCALFKPPQDTSPPFIGIIRWLTSSKEDCLKLGVNWLYRPADVKLGKGILLEAAPNEVFYSFHKDEILAASILHPCKVAFLRKGFELPSGISSFVCRRVYDTTNKCLWWLTDQDYINDRQEEVDQLLDKTRQEMHAAVQSGGRSPKSLNGPTSTQPLKPGTDSAHSSPTSFSSQVKGKKRERVDQAFEPIKRERLLKTDEGDLGNCKVESMIKSEIAKIKDYRGGLANFKGVEKLVQLMQPDRTEKKVDLASRIMLLDVIAVTDQFECLGQFMQLRGIAILDEWLQEVHKGKVGDSSSPKESDKSVEDFLFALLRALNKLPVNLHALQTCNVGKSVNNLRTHKNLEIQKKARSLVDTWKKRVEAEMRSNEAKSRSNQAMSWPTKPGPPEVSPGGNKRIGVSSEAPTKSSVTQPSSAYKTTPVKLGHGDGTPKPTASSPGSVKFSASFPASVAMTSKESHSKFVVSTGASDIPPTTMKEEKSSSSGQSQNNSQSCSSDQAKNVGSAWKEDARSSTAGSMNVNMTSSGASRHRKPNNGILGSPVSGVQKETPFSKSGSLNRSGTSEKVLLSGLTCERTHDVPVVEHGNSHRFIVRLPNPGRSPAQSASGGLFDDASITTSRASSPGISEKHDQYDRKLKGRSDSSCRRNATDINPESWQSNDVRNGFSGSDEGVGSPAPVLDEELCRTPVTGKSMDTTKATCSSSINDKGVISSESKPGKAHNASVSSINVLIESCVKYSETNASMPIGDDIGMNLLASVAAGEMTKSDQASPLSSPGRNSALQEDSSTGNETKSRFSREDVSVRYEGKSENDVGGDLEKQGNVDGPSPVNNGLLHTSNISDSKNNSSFTREKATGGCSEKFKTTSYNLQQNTSSNLKLDGKPDKTVSAVSMVVSSAEMGEESAMGDIVDGLHKKQKTGVTDLKNDGGKDLKPKAEYPFPDENKVDHGDEVSASNKTVASDPVHGSVSGRCETDILSSSIRVEKEAVSESKLLEMNDEKKHHVHERLIGGTSSDPDAMDATRAIKDCADNVMHQSGPANVLKKKSFVVSKCEKVDSVEVSLKFKRRMNKITRKFSMELIDVIPDGQVGISAVVGHIDVCTNESDNKEVLKQQSCESALNAESPIIPAEDAEHCTKSVGSKTSGVEGDFSDECASTAEATTLSVAEGCDKGERLDFDLNEGFSLDEGNQSLPVTLAGPGCLPAVHLPSTLQFPLSSITNGLPASITVAAAAKGPFVPPEIPLKGTGELGWKGSAATSAFRPAEPRKVLEMPLSTTDFPPDVNAGRQGRPALDIDLNVADERNLEDMIPQTSVREISSEYGLINYRALGRNEMLCSAPASACSTGGLDLDLNRVDEDNDVVQFSTNAIRRHEVPLMPAGPSASGGFPIVEMNALRDFDLNNGPGLDDMGTEPVFRGQHAKNSVPFLSSVNGPRMSSTELGSLSSWLPHGNSYPAVAIPSILSDREQPYPGAGSASMQRMLGPPSGGLTFSPDVFRGPVLSSSPAVAFSPAAPFSYPGFPFGASYPLTSTSFTGGSASYMDSSSGGGLCFPAVPSQLVGPAGSVSSQYPRPYVMMSLPDGSNGGAESSRNWRRQGLDLNAGPGATDLEGRDERLPSTSRQLSIASSHALAEEHARMYQVAGGLLKRKEPEGGWDAERFSYKQPSWQ